MIHLDAQDIENSLPMKGSIETGPCNVPDPKGLLDVMEMLPKILPHLSRKSAANLGNSLSSFSKENGAWPLPLIPTMPNGVFRVVRWY